jgi:hypothetical protein
MMPIIFDAASPTHAQVFSTNLSFVGLLNEEGGSGFPNTMHLSVLYVILCFLVAFAIFARSP